jgi:hypothetical protein
MGLDVKSILELVNGCQGKVKKLTLDGLEIDFHEPLMWQPAPKDIQSNTGDENNLMLEDPLAFEDKKMEQLLNGVTE